MSLRLEETFTLIEQDLSHLGFLERLRGGVIAQAGGAHVPQIDAPAERIFQLPASPAKRIPSD